MSLPPPRPPTKPCAFHVEPIQIAHEDPTSILWNPENQKSNRREEIVICVELAGLLRAWRVASEAPALASPLVFPVPPHKRSWADDRARAGLARNDTRGRPLSAHSARKWFKTELVRAGVHADLIDRLMRHAPDVGSRYYDPTPAEMAEAVACLPKIWPTQLFEPSAFATLSPKSGPKGLDSGRENPIMNEVTPMMHTPTQPANPRPEPRIGVTSDRPVGAGIPALYDRAELLISTPGNCLSRHCGGDVARVFGEAAGDNPATERSASSKPEQVGSNAPGERPGLPITAPGRDDEGHRREDDRADLLESVARLLRGGRR